MNQRSLKYAVALASALTLAGSAYAQAVTPSTTETAAPAAKSTTPVATAEAEDTIILTPFEVTADSDVGYLATQTMAGSRINTKLDDVGSAISVVTPEFLKDVGATDNKSLLAYTVSTEVGGTQGNFKNASGGQNQDESGSFTSPNQNTRVRGLTSADNTRNFFMSSIPWEGYNIDRVELQRGPNSILFGLGSPAGIINTTTKTAQHRNFGEAEIRVGSYGTHRETLDANYNLLKKELSVRINLVRNDEKYKQDPAYSFDRRAFATLRYDPAFLNKNGHKTTLKFNLEAGRIDSNNPRSITPTDLITPWWTKLNQRIYNPATAQYSGKFYNAENPKGYFRPNTGEYNPTYAAADGGAKNPYYQPWLGAPSMYGGVWMPIGHTQTSPSTYALMPEYKNIGGISSAGKTDASIGGLPYYRRVTVASTAYWAERDTTAPYQSWGVWKSGTLSDPTVFDFYNKLLDGDNKKEWQRFDNKSIFLTQTFFNDKFGFDAAYDTQRVRRGQYSFNGGGPLYVDINDFNIDGTKNPNVARAYVESNYFYGNNASSFTEESGRVSAFFNHDFNKNRNGNWLKKLAGRHVLSGLYSYELTNSDRRSFARYGTPDSFGAMLNTSNDAYKLLNNDRAVTNTIYMSGSLLGKQLGTNLGIDTPTTAVVPSEVQFKYFNSTWNGGSVSPSAAWTSTFNGQTSTQSENPANYVGWTTTPVKILSAENGDQDALTYSASLDRRRVDSKAVVLQSYFWDGTVVGMYGVRSDRVKAWGIQGAKEKTKLPNGTVIDNDRIDFTNYTTNGSNATITEANNPSWSVVAKLSKLLPEKFPLNISFYYNESSNFQVTNTRNDIYGQAIASPSGETKDRGIMISTKNERFSLRINKYETRVLNASNTTGIPTWYLLGGGDNFIIRGENRADAYEYKLWELGNPASANWSSGSWTWRWSPLNGQTQAQADAASAAACAAWRQYTAEPIVQAIRKAWGFNDFNVTQWTSMSTPVANFTATEDQLAKGWEYEFTANPTKNWRISMNAAQTEASRTNIGGTALSEFIDLTAKYQEGPMGDLRTWGGASSSTLRTSWNSNFYSKYLLMKLQEGTFSSELRKWRYNAVSNYNFTTGFMKGVNVGVGYRWQDKVAIGYPVKSVTASKVVFDIENAYYGPSTDAIDLWVGYQRKLSKKLDWRIQLNIRNLGDGNSLVPLSAQYDGSIAAWGIAPSQSWTLSNTFKF